MSNMNNKVILLTLLALLVASSAAFADIVKGRVVDSDTKEPLPEATVTWSSLKRGLCRTQNWVPRTWTSKEEVFIQKGVPSCTTSK